MLTENGSASILHVWKQTSVAVAVVALLDYFMKSESLGRQL
jgi:hypothetical protein